MKRLLGVLLLVAGFGIPDLAAQMTPMEAAGDGIGPEIFGLAGVVQPLGNLTENSAAFGMVIPPDVVIGGEFTFWASRVVGIGVMGLYSPATLNGVGGGTGRGPGRLGELEYMAGTVNLTFRIRSSGSAGALEPYFSMGGGLRRLNFYGDAVPEISSTDPAATVAAGIRVALTSSLWFRGELRDVASYYISGASEVSRLQNDVTITMGFGIR